MRLIPQFTRLHSGENISRRLDYTLSEALWDKTARLGFVTPMGRIFITDPLTVSEGKGHYLLPCSLLDGKGLLLCQLTVSGSDGFMAKSPVLELPVFASVDDTSCPTVSEEGLKSLAVIFDAVRDKADAVHSHNEAYYTKGETDAFLAEKQNSVVLDRSPERGSSNPVTSGGVFDAIEDIRQASSAARVETMTNSDIENILGNN